MGVKEDFIAVTILKKIACSILSIALLFIWIAFTCTGWGEENKSTKDWHIGLWRRCSSRTSFECTGLDGYAADWFGFTQASAIFAFVGINVSSILVCLAVFSARWKDKEDNFFFIVSILCLSTGVFFFIGIIVFGAKFKEEFVDTTSEYRFSYAFGLAIVGCIAQIAVGILLLVEKLMSKQKVNQNPTE